MKKYFVKMFPFFIVVLFYSPGAFTADKIFPSTKIGAYYSLFSGEKNSSFSTGNSGVGLEVAIEGKGSFLPTYVKGHIISTTGRQTFLDGMSEVTASFSCYQTLVELGFHIYPLIRRESGINIYLGAAGSVGYNFLTLSSPSATFRELKSNDQSSSVGALGIVGTEWIIGKKMLYSEVGFRSETANLAGKDKFKLNSFSISIGFGW
jgi:hypothetical protein